MDRHCAFCHEMVAQKNVKSCPGCSRRAYCSEKCQDLDYASNWISIGGLELGQGQGHVDWCEVTMGEQDLDFIVGPKGRGLIAKRSFPAKFRILVEGFKGIDFRVKPREAANSLHLSNKMNHACDANASRCYEPFSRVSILYSKKEIKKGEEITVNYIPYNESFVDVPFPFRHIGMNLDGSFVLGSFQEVRNMLSLKWGIICPPSCFCRKDGLDEKRAEAVKLYGKNESLDFRGMRHLLELWKELKGNLQTRAAIYKNCTKHFVGKNFSNLKLQEELTDEMVIMWTLLHHPDNKYATFFLKEKERQKLMNVESISQNIFVISNL